MTPPPGHPTNGPQTTPTSPKTNHAEKARELLDNAYQTARLADEARTANLIALWDALRNPPAGYRLTDARWAQIERLDDLIAARLDLTQDVTP